MRHHIRIYLRLQLTHIKAQLSYRSDTWIAMLGMLLSQVSGLIFINALFAQSSNISGWTATEVMFLYGLVLLPRGLVEVFAEGQWHLQHLVNEGSFDRVLLRPLSPALQVVAYATGVHGLGSIALGFTLLAWTIAQLSIALTLFNVLVLSMIILFTVIAILSVQIAVCCIVFWEPSSTSLFPVTATNLFEFAKHPLTMYGPGVRYFLSWVVPLAWIIYHPACAVLGKEGHHPIWYAPIAVLFLVLLARTVWTRSLGGYQGVGH